MFRTGAQLMILVLLTGLGLLLESRREPLASCDNFFADFLAMNSRRGAKPAPLTLVEINDSSLANHAWPWTPLDFSLFFQATLPFKPEVIAIDEVLDWNRLAIPDDQRRKLPQYEKILRESILRVPKMLLGAQLGFPDDPQVVPPLQEVPLVRNVRGNVTDIPEFVAIERQPAEDYRLSSTVGFTNLPREHHRFNSVPLLFRYRGQVTPGFVLQAVMLWAKATPDEIVVELGSHIMVQGKTRIPIDGAGRMRVDFGSPRNTFGFDDLLLASEQAAAGGKPAVPTERLNGAFLLLSRTDTAARTVPLASGREGSPGELFAAAIATIQNGSFIERAPLLAEGIVIACAMLFGFRIARWKKAATVFAAIAAMAAYVLIAMAIFDRTLVWMPIVLPTGMLLVAVIYRLATPDSAGKPKRPVIF